MQVRAGIGVWFQKADIFVEGKFCEALVHQSINFFPRPFCNINSNFLFV